MKYGCNSYYKDVNKMVEVPKEYQFDGKRYVLWDTQYSEPNAQISHMVILNRVPKSDPRILAVKEDDKEPVFGIYVKEGMTDE